MIKRLNPNFVAGIILSALLALCCLVLVPPPHGARAQFPSQATFAGTAGGSANVITLTMPNVGSYADVKGVQISFLPATPNTGPVTININGLGATTLFRGTAALTQLGGGELNSYAIVISLGTSFALISPLDTTPVGTAIDIRGTTAPTGYLIEDGSCVSQTTFVALFAKIGTIYGSCSAGLFAVPDSRGSSYVAMDNQGSNGAANRITVAGSSCDATGIRLCGNQNQTLTIPQLPTVTPAGSVTAVSGSGNTSNINVLAAPNSIGVGGGSITPLLSNGTGAGSLTTIPFSFSGASGTFTGTPFGSGAAHPILNPISLGLRAIKY